MNHIYFFILICISFFSFILNKNELFILFGFQLFVISLHLFSLKYVFYLFSPLILLIFYINISLFIGGAAFATGNISSKYFLYTYSQWDSMSISSFYLLFSTSLIYYIDCLYRPLKKNIIERPKFIKDSSLSYFCIFLIVILLINFLPINLEFLGASGSIKQIFILTGIFGLIAFIISKGKKVSLVLRLIIYVSIVYLLMDDTVRSKRELIFAIFPVLFLEMYISDSKYNLKVVFSMMLISFFIIILIMQMSILRGHGYAANISTGNNSINLRSIYEYYLSDAFIPFFMDNMEFSFFYFNAYNSMELVLKNSELLTWGSTIIKPLFIFIPRSIFPSKPASMINIYTLEANPILYADGGSWPINILSEFFWNFHFLSFIFIIFFSMVVLKIYYKFLIVIPKTNIGVIAFGLLVYMIFIMLIRGCGFDLFAIYCLSSLIIVIITNSIYNLLKK